MHIAAHAPAYTCVYMVHTENARERRAREVARAYMHSRHIKYVNARASSLTPVARPIFFPLLRVDLIGGIAVFLFLDRTTVHLRKTRVSDPEADRPGGDSLCTASLVRVSVLCALR